MENVLHIPFKPIDASLTAQVGALDLLSAKISTLPTKTRWPIRVPLTSKASFRGDVVDTNEIKVHVGDGWWIDMTAYEASEYVIRRKRALLESQARMLEGKSNQVDLDEERNKRDSTDGKKTLLPPKLAFNPIFASTAVAGPSRPPTSLTSSPINGVSPLQSIVKNSTDSTTTSLHKDGTAQSLQQLVDLVGDQLEEKLQIKNGSPSSAKGKGKGVDVLDDKTVLNDEGLPFHEIRETEDGISLDPIPESSDNITGSQTISVDSEEGDYWSAEAVARREALKRRLFSDGIPSSDEDEDEVEDVKEAEPPSDSKTLTPPISYDQKLSPPSALRRPSSSPSSTNPKSILKPPIRKKSVSFDESVPLPPKSPPDSTSESGSGRLGFPLPTRDNLDPQTIPSIIEPNSAVKPGQDKGFGGFKRGFLDTGKGGKNISATTVSAQSIKSSSESQVPSSAAPTVKKPSLFAQRLAQQANSLPATAKHPSPVVVTPAVTSQPNTKLSLPKLSESKPMTSMKSTVVEKLPSSSVPSVSTPTTGSGSTDAGQSKIIDAINNHEGEEDHEEDEDDDEDDYGDLGDFSEGEEDEYDLDEALLAREVALEYHRRRQYHPPPEEIDEWIPEDEEDNIKGGGNVIMGLPRISDFNGNIIEPPKIVNPTPEDLGRFVRVGRLENGNLVLASTEGEDGGDGGSDDDLVESGDKGREEMRRRREEVKRRLIVGDTEEVVDLRETPVQKQRLVQREREIVRSSLPPTVKTVSEVVGTPSKDMEKTMAVSETVKERVGEGPVISEPAPPKKVSRFKQARQAAAGF